MQPRASISIENEKEEEREEEEETGEEEGKRGLTLSYWNCVPAFFLLF